ncbi:LytR/AlgR family response regulator transcription factor [Chitinophaga sp. NPDC101104]|uniref:LytR/AlgR family response regulator transcription factor n=1 Tax=Chitinophaga sp. NPDC101104 TaxID=3390561 RepID=UPI003D08503E
MSLQCLIVDDEPLAHDVILQYARDIPDLEIVGQCYLATEALAFLNRRPVDLIFLDIRMPRLSGLDFLRTLQHRPLVIITSAYEEHALEGYELEVCDYLLKPFRFDRFLKAVNRAQSIFQLRESEKQQRAQQGKGQEQWGPSTGNSPASETPPARSFPQEGEPVSPANPYKPDDRGRLFVKSDRKWVQVELEQVQYLESLGNYVKIWESERFILTPRTLSSFEEQLPGETFVRIHKSFILNRRFVRSIEGNTVQLKSGKQLPLGKNYRHVVRLLLQ